MVNLLLIGWSIENGAALHELADKLKKFWEKVEDIII